MPIWLLIGIILLLFLLLYPIRVHLYTEERFRVDVIIYGVFRKRLNVRKMLARLWGTSTDTKKREKKERENPSQDFFDIDNVTEAFRKLLSTGPFIQKLAARSTVEEFNWYSAIPMENPVLGLSLLPIYTTAQTLVIDYMYTYFRRIKDYDIDTKYNYLTEDILIYFNSIIRFNLLKILIVGIKLLVYSRKRKKSEELKLKRST